MREFDTRVVIIGGGATGVGILRDLSMRGISAILLEQRELGHGTSSRFHGLLHSGGRYVVKDEDAARECIDENEILKRIAPTCIEGTSGWFVHLQDDNPDYMKAWLTGCSRVKIPVKEIAVAEALRLEPMLSRHVEKVYEVPDASIDGFKLLWANIRSAERYNGKFMTYCNVSSVRVENGCVKGVYAENVRTGEKIFIHSEIVINAAGPWAGMVAASAGAQVSIIKNKGVLLVFNKRLFQRVINRLRAPRDGDIFVPHETITILGTTSYTVGSPDDNWIMPEEVSYLMNMGKELLDDIEHQRVIRAFAGIRPLYEEASTVVGEGREISRDFALVDHEKLDGITGFISIVGGKLTTYRLMAEKVTDWVCNKLGLEVVCRTAEESLIPPVEEKLKDKARTMFGVAMADKMMERLNDRLGEVVKQVSQDPAQGQLICECEMITKAEIKHVVHEFNTTSLNDVRRQTRLGMGTCQGAFCTYRAIPLLADLLEEPGKLREEITDFLDERWRGVVPILWGEQLRESELTRAIFNTTLGVGQREQGR